MYIKESENRYSYKLNSKNLVCVIYVTEEQKKKLEKYRITARKIDTKIVNIFPAVYIRGTRLHLGKFLYPDNKKPWDASIWVDKMWDYTPGNVKVDSEEKTHCGTCGIWTPKKDTITSYCCNDCWYLQELLRYAKGRANDKLRKLHIQEFNLDLSMFVGQKTCQLTGIPLLFKPDAGLSGASLDRIDSQKGYTRENTRLICHGLNQLKLDKSDAVLSRYIQMSKLGKVREVEITDSMLKIIKREVNSTKFKRLTQFTDMQIDVEYMIEMLKATKGVCKITGVELDMWQGGPYSLYAPSVDRIDSMVGYTKSNTEIISQGANRMKGMINTTEETIKIYKKVLNSPIIEILKGDLK